jgi:hypothetical protein
MAEESLRELLARVHERLQSSRSVDERSRDLLRTVMLDIERALDASETPGVKRSALHRPATDAEHESPGSLEELAVSFEAEHPSLARTLRQLIDALGKAGI